MQIDYIMPFNPSLFSKTIFPEVQRNTFNKPNKQKQYCIFNEPTTILQSTIKKPVPNTYSNIYTQGKIKAKSPNQSRKMEYAAYARNFGRTAVIGPC